MANTSDNWDDALYRAICVVGGPSHLARIIGVKSPSIYSWRRAPAKHAAAIERASGVPRHVLRPDLWDPPPSRRRRATPNSPAAAE